MFVLFIPFMRIRTLAKRVLPPLRPSVYPSVRAAPIQRIFRDM